MHEIIESEHRAAFIREQAFRLEQTINVMEDDKNAVVRAGGKVVQIRGVINLKELGAKVIWTVWSVSGDLKYENSELGSKRRWWFHKLRPFDDQDQDTLKEIERHERSPDLKDAFHLAVSTFCDHIADGNPTL